MSDNELIQNKVCAIIAKNLSKKAIRKNVIPEMDLRSDLGVDSIGLMTIVFTLEEEFSVDFFPYASRFVAASSVKDLVEIVHDALEGVNA